MRMQFPAPLRDTKEIQPHRRMRVSEYSRYPGIGCLDRYAQFLVQLAHQRMMRRFPWLDLAAGELPVTSPDFVFGTLGQEELAIRFLPPQGGRRGVSNDFAVTLAQQDGSGNFNDFFSFGIQRDSSFRRKPESSCYSIRSP